MNEQTREKTTLPLFFKPILWSYDFSAVDPECDRKTIVVNAINYGDLEHWRWLIERYGKETIRENLERIPATEFRPRALKLATLIFSPRHFNHAHRSVT